MAGDLIVGHRSVPQLQYAEGAFSPSLPWIQMQVASASALLRKTADSLVMAGQEEIFLTPRSVSEWEQISHAVHQLRTNGVAYHVVKRLLDIFTVCALLPCLLPLFLIVAAIVRLSSPGPVLYHQKRIGRFGKEFTLWKFRSMYVNGDEILRQHLGSDAEAAREWKQTRKLKNDPRVTRLGVMLRRASLDELPQFLNVLSGSMSLVGPRPIVAAEKPQYRDAYFFYTSAKPGLTGLWQVSGRSDLSYRQRVSLDEEYVRKWDLALDIRILCRTAGIIWGSRGAV